MAVGRPSRACTRARERARWLPVALLHVGGLAQVFGKVLIANRGEISVRIVRALREMGLTSVAVYSDPDRKALHASLADEAYHVGPAPAAQSYLNVERLIEVARKSGAEAVHPGYGFLVAVKASSGGGGKGFALANDASQARSAFERASREGETYFGDGSVYVEKYLSAPRHVEIQVVRDRHGNAVHLGERDCSIQRRHQKLIEECPSPAIDPKMREAMGGAALAAAEAVDYDNVGTVEFLVEKGGATGEFYFLEMNTRVQVEHPVTEEVTGIDIVKTGIRIAAGEELPFSQRDIHWRGHAIEVRLNAEDASNDFVPSPGVVTVYEEPGGPGVRVDSSLRGPGVVADSYDPLFAKLIVRGADRKEALARLGRALAEFRVEGISTTLPFFRAILSDEAFVSGDYSTGFVAERMSLLEIEPSSLGIPGEPATDREKTTREVEVEVNGKLFRVKVFGEEDQRSTAGPPRRRQGEMRRASASGGAIAAPMQGTIVRVLVEEGQEVEADEPVCILEAMKMESEVRSQKAGTVSEVSVESGQTVRSGETLILVE